MAYDKTPPVTVKVEGTDDIAELFQALSNDMKGAVLNAATQSAALPILNRVRITIPEGGHTPYKSGTLRRSFFLNTVERGATRCVVAVSTNVPYAARLEYGFVGKDKLGRIYNQPPRPYIRPAFDEKVDESTAEFKAALTSIIERRARRAAN